MTPERTGHTSRARARAARSGERTAAGAAKRAALESFVWGGVIAGLVLADFTVRDHALRTYALRAILVLAAAGEGLASISGIFRPRWFAERSGRPYEPAYHGVMQDFGFYNLGFALLFGLAVLDPVHATSVITIATVVYAIHATTHVLRYFGLYFGGGTAIPTRPRGFELRDGLQLTAAAAGIALFFP
jgi:hypothetical protein